VVGGFAQLHDRRSETSMAASAGSSDLLGRNRTWFAGYGLKLMVGRGGLVRCVWSFCQIFTPAPHSEDVARLQRIVTEAQTFGPDLVLLGGDFVNMQLFGGGRVPPQVVVAALARLDGPVVASL